MYLFHHLLFKTFQDQINHLKEIPTYHLKRITPGYPEPSFPIILKIDQLLFPFLWKRIFRTGDNFSINSNISIQIEAYYRSTNIWFNPGTTIRIKCLCRCFFFTHSALNVSVHTKWQKYANYETMNFPHLILYFVEMSRFSFSIFANFWWNYNDFTITIKFRKLYNLYDSLFWLRVAHLDVFL